MKRSGERVGLLSRRPEDGHTLVEPGQIQPDSARDRTNSSRIRQCSTNVCPESTSIGLESTLGSRAERFVFYRISRHHDQVINRLRHGVSRAVLVDDNASSVRLRQAAAHGSLMRRCPKTQREADGECDGCVRTPNSEFNMYVVSPRPRHTKIWCCTLLGLPKRGGR